MSRALSIIQAGEFPMKGFFSRLIMLVLSRFLVLLAY